MSAVVDAGTDAGEVTTTALDWVVIVAALICAALLALWYVRHGQPPPAPPADQ